MTKILLVEDDKSLREIYGVRLLAEGYDIVSAGDGEQALAMAIKERPQLIISDIMMPAISGFDMLDILRSTTETKDIKVIIMTALSSEDQRARGEALGADRYLVKSQVGIEDVVRTVHEVLSDAPVRSVPPAQAFGMPAASTPSPRPAAPAIPSRPAAPQSAPPAPRPPVVAPASQQPTPLPPPAPSFTPPPATASPLPQPTAPFSTARPASLGERIIHPLSQPAPQADIASRIDQELSAPVASAVPPAAPPPTPVSPPPSIPQSPQPPSPAPQASSAPSPPAPVAPDLSFEETPRPAAPPPPPAA